MSKKAGALIIALQRLNFSSTLGHAHARMQVCARTLNVVPRCAELVQIAAAFALPVRELHFRYGFTRAQTYIHIHSDEDITRVQAY